MNGDSEELEHLIEDKQVLEETLKKSMGKNYSNINQSHFMFETTLTVITSKFETLF